MSIEISRRSELSAHEIESLDRAMAAFYAQTPSSYYEIAGRAAEQYTPAQQPFHMHLLEQVRPGMSVLEMGCGTAHLCPHVENRGGIYTGIDHSPDLLRANSSRFPQARFLPVGAMLERQFDLVASLYTIEHVVDPPAYLQAMWSACRPGGLLAVICPEFIECEGFPQSVFYGNTARRLREKIQSFALADALRHALEVKWLAPRWKAAARQSPPGAFWINTRPAVLHGGAYSIDADAVHLSTLRDLVWWFESRSATIVTSSKSLPGVPPAVLRFNCYLLARKPHSDPR